MSDDLPPDTITTLDASAMKLHEVYQSFLKAGFTKTQATGFIEQLVVEEIYGSGQTTEEGD